MKLTRRRIVSGLAALLAAAASGTAAPAGVLRLSRYYTGPVTDHFDGTHFTGRYAVPSKGTAAFWRWQTNRKAAAWPQHVANPASDRPPPRVDGDALRVSFVGHATVLIQTAGLNILIDPIWSERASPFTFAGPHRVTDPGIAFNALPPIDAVLVSHAHYDHLDLATLSRLAAKHNPRVITPLGNDALMRGHDPAIRAEAHDWHVRVTLNNDVAVTLVPAQHWAARGLFDRNTMLWSGFVIETLAGRIYNVSDTGYGDGALFREARERYGPFRFGIFPIGAYEPRWFMREQHMNPQEAVQAFIDSGAHYALGNHYGTFQLTDEAIDAPLHAFLQARAQAGIAPERFRALRPGESWTL